MAATTVTVNVEGMKDLQDKLTEMSDVVRACAARAAMWEDLKDELVKEIESGDHGSYSNVLYWMEKREAKRDV